MPKIVFFDTEIEPGTGKLLAIGAIREPDFASHHQVGGFNDFIKGTEFMAGHNVFRHDLKYISKTAGYAIPITSIIDTLDLAPLLFPRKPYHHLVKDDKLNTEELNNPLNDAKKARELFYDEINEFRALDPGFLRYPKG